VQVVQGKNLFRILPNWEIQAPHHDIPFYAELLHISPVYLPRVVRQVTGRTVVDYMMDEFKQGLGPVTWYIRSQDSRTWRWGF
jgi:hypothetical protein